MRKILLLLSILIFSSCDTNSNGDMSINGFGWFIIILFGVFIISLILHKQTPEEKEYNEKLRDGSLDKEYKSIGKYVGGHPCIDNTIDKVLVNKIEDDLVFYIGTGYSMPKIINDSNIHIKDIKNITIEDASTIERKITVGRLLLVGIFAFAWKKKKKNEMAFVVIEWNKDRFANNTSFCFEGKNAFELANKARNVLINMVS